ncbi:hypothetical protein [Mariprofundus ferrooxydans]|uniref:hypothetical protein n=1 Tax=Mariprofundus ferrooxydans TaxID=314344 RepID=UPI00036260C6|nr:hypothetical protein [Mariprofundus ferrooxydans]
MKIQMAHIREKSTSGGYIDFAVFDARSSSGTESANNQLLSQLTTSAMQAGLKIDQSALAYMQGNQVRFWGSRNLVDYLSKSGVPQWTHEIDA